MSPYCVVKSYEADGIGKIIGVNGAMRTVEYFNLPTDDGRVVREVEANQIRPKILGKNTRVYVFEHVANHWRVGRVTEDDGDGLYIRFSHRNDAYLSYEQVFVRWKRPIEDPVLFLAEQITETPQYAAARAQFLEAYIAQRGIAHGISALLSSAIELEAHQIGVVRRVLTDPCQRYLLADEVGLGKTIEAGVIIRQAVLDDPANHRVVILVPRTLVAQWRHELIHRFGLSDFLGISVNVIARDNHAQLLDALEQATLLVIDEVHHIADPGAPDDLRQLYDLIRRMARHIPRLLLLSATPILRNEEGFLRMLHLLDPAVYSLDDYESFRTKIAHRQSLAETVAMLDPSQALFLDGVLDELLEKLPRDVLLRELTLVLKAVLVNISDEDDPALIEALRLLRGHISETYRLNRRILRNRRRRIVGLTPLRKGAHPWLVKDASVRPIEAALESWRISATASLSEKGDVTRQASLAGFYWECVTALLENMAMLRQVCEQRRQVLRTDPDATMANFENEANYLTELLVHCDEEDWMVHRVDALMDHLRQLSGNVKAIVFCSSSEVADIVYRQLLHNHISTVRHLTIAEDDSDIEPDWARFLTDNDVKVIVCDREAEEGINLQGGNKVIVHFDLPIHPNRIEQRIGRVDRYGSGMPVQSYVLLDATSEFQNVWFDVLDRGLNVFGQSISSLQYIVDAEGGRLQETVFLHGTEAMTELLARLQGPQGLVATELKLIDQQDALDELVPLPQGDIETLLEFDDDWKSIKQSMFYWITDTLFFASIPEKLNQPCIDIPTRFQYNPPEQGGRATLIPMSCFLEDFLGVIDYEARGSSSSHPLSYPHTAHRTTVLHPGAVDLRDRLAIHANARGFMQGDARGGHAIGRDLDVL